MDLCDLDEWLCLSPDRELQSQGSVLVMAARALGTSCPRQVLGKYLLVA